MKEKKFALAETKLRRTISRSGAGYARNPLADELSRPASASASASLLAPGARASRHRHLVVSRHAARCRGVRDGRDEVVAVVALRARMACRSSRSGSARRSKVTCWQPRRRVHRPVADEPHPRSQRAGSGRAREPGVTRKQLNATCTTPVSFSRSIPARMPRWAAWRPRAHRGPTPCATARCATTCSASRSCSPTAASSAPAAARASRPQATT